MPNETPPPVVPDYQLLRVIGKGFFGEVWLARNALGAFRAVKVVRRAAFDDPANYDREFAGVRNFEPLSREHPGLVDLLDVGVNEAEGFFYYAMELADAAMPPIEDGGWKIEGGSTAPASILNPPSSILAPIDPASYVPRTLQSEYHRQGRLPLDECLRVGVALTDALEFLHGHSLIHRDIKPSNIIFVGGVPKLADVGTVTHVSEARTMVGTDGFRAPEGPGKPQADLFSLGKVLYEISTGKDRQRFPEPLTKLADLPDHRKWLEFNAVVDKACAHEPTRRYPSTTELRADLLDLQHGRSVRQRWRREKRLKQAAWAVAALAVLVASLLCVQFVRVRAAEKGLALLELEKAIRPPHTAGWSTKAWQIASNAAAKFGFDTNLQSQAAASLAGLDAHCLFQTNGIGGSSVAFSPDGRWVLYGALQDPARTDAPGKAHLLDLTTTNLVGYPVPGEGPVAFFPDGTPVQLSVDTKHRLALWSAGVSTAFGAASPDGGAQSGQDVRAPQATALRSFTLPAGDTIGAITALALTPAARFVAASGTNTTGQPFLAAWDGTTARLLLPVAASLVSAANSIPEDQRRSPETPLRGQPATALAFTPDGSLLAAGHESGEVLVWRVPSQSASADVEPRVPPALSASDPAEPAAAASPLSRRDGRLYLAPDTSPLARIPASRLPILSLAFCRDYVRDPLHPAPEPQWLLAIGDAGGEVTIWELPAKARRMRCPGGHFEISALAFSPDGALLAAAGRGPTKLMDTATGAEVLSIGAGDMLKGVCFAADGRRFAACSEEGYATAELNTWSVAQDRSIRVLRGLDHRVTRVCLSGGGSFAAALANDWRVGVWNPASNQLLHVFQMPRGNFTADNAGMAFNLDGSRFAFMAGTNAMLLDTVSGTRVWNWQLPPGYVEELAFDRAGRLLAFHFESADTNAKTFSRPAAARIRELSPAQEPKLLMTLPELNHNVQVARWAPDASFITIDGSGTDGDQTSRQVKAVAPFERRILWSKQVHLRREASALRVDGVGRYVLVTTNEMSQRLLIEARTGEIRGHLSEGLTLLNSAQELGVATGSSSEGWSLRSLRSSRPLLHVQPNAGVPASSAVFSADGQFLAIGMEDGTVRVCELANLRQQLDTARLGW